jgi:hypothetical protein
MSRKAFQRAVASVALVVCVVAAPTAVLAEGRYVPGYEPSHQSSDFGLLGAYGLATVSVDAHQQVMVTATRAAPTMNLAAEIVPHMGLISAPVELAADLQSATLPSFNFKADRAPARVILLAAR